ELELSQVEFVLDPRFLGESRRLDGSLDALRVALDGLTVHYREACLALHFPLQLLVDDALLLIQTPLHQLGFSLLAGVLAGKKLLVLLVDGRHLSPLHHPRAHLTVDRSRRHGETGADGQQPHNPHAWTIHGGPPHPLRPCTAREVRWRRPGGGLRSAATPNVANSCS